MRGENIGRHIHKRRNHYQVPLHFSLTMLLHASLVAALLLLVEVRGLGDIVYAVNCGGEEHADIYGIRYARDASRVGTPSDYGKQLIIGRVPAQDQIIYQTERYHINTFGYDIPVEEDGWYLLVLKFSEVYFSAPNMKVSSLKTTTC
jgi:hypothetical protein